MPAKTRLHEFLPFDPEGRARAPEELPHTAPPQEELVEDVRQRRHALRHGLPAQREHEPDGQAATAAVREGDAPRRIVAARLPQHGVDAMRGTAQPLFGVKQGLHWFFCDRTDKNTMRVAAGIVSLLAALAFAAGNTLGIVVCLQEAEKDSPSLDAIFVSLSPLAFGITAAFLSLRSPPESLETLFGLIFVGAGVYFFIAVGVYVNTGALGVQAVAACGCGALFPLLVRVALALHDRSIPPLPR